jgi:hypothetical protein
MDLMTPDAKPGSGPSCPGGPVTIPPEALKEVKINRRWHWFSSMIETTHQVTLLKCLSPFVQSCPSLEKWNIIDAKLHANFNKASFILFAQFSQTKLKNSYVWYSRGLKLQGESMEPDITSRILRCSAVEKGRSKIRQISYPKNKLPTSPHRLEAPSAS